MFNWESIKMELWGKVTHFLLFKQMACKNGLEGIGVTVA